MPLHTHADDNETERYPNDRRCNTQNNVGVDVLAEVHNKANELSQSMNIQLDKLVTDSKLDRRV